MYNKNSLLISIIGLLAMVVSASAVDKVWTNTANDGLWKTTGNWTGGLPVAGDKAKVVKTPGATIDSSTAAVCQWLVVADASPGALTMTGGTLNVSGATDSWTIIAYGPTDVGTFTMNGGTVTTSNRFFVGYQGTGTLTVNGGTMNIGGAFGIGYGESFTTGKGTVNLVGGTINVTKTPPNFYMGSNGLSRLEVNGGTLILAGDQRTQINSYINNGWITYLGGSYVLVDYDITNPGKTTVQGPPNLMPARNPSPASGAAGVLQNTILQWTASTDATSHDVYFGTNFSDVNSVSRILADLNGNGIVDWNDISILTQYWLLDPVGSEPYAGVNDDNSVDLFDYAMLSQDWMNSANPAFKGNQDANSYDPGTLAVSTTYYWRIDEVNGPNTVKGNIWSFATQSGKASNPNPANNASGVATSATLSWTTGAGATTRNVYFGTTNPPAYRGNYSSTSFNPGTLANSTTYFWRIDEVSGSGTTTGDMWQFTTQAPPPPANLKKGPYLIFPGNNTQMTVLWQLTATSGATLDWGTDSSYSAGTTTTTEYGTDHQHKYNITGLTPDTKYYYRLTIGTSFVTGSFNAAPAADATNVKFFMYGDTRSYPTSNNAVLSQVVSTYNADPAYQTMMLHAGDWVNVSDEATWTSQWYTIGSNSNIWTATASMPFMGCIGNHESGGIAVYQKYRPFNFVNPSRTYYSFDYGPVHVSVLDQWEAGDGVMSAAQISWLTTDLSTSTKPWKIIVLHAPGWQAAGGHPNNTQVQNTIQPLCVTYGVQIVLGGHVHYYSRAVVNGVQHVTSGGGGADLYTPVANQPNVVTYSKSLEYCRVAISGNTLTCTALSSTGSVLDTFTINRP